MDVTIETIGGGAMGLVLGYIAMMFITRAVKETPTAANFAAFVGVLFGGAAVSFLAERLGADSQIYGAYAIGVGVGFILYLIMYFLGGPTRSTTLAPFRSSMP